MAKRKVGEPKTAYVVIKEERSSPSYTSTTNIHINAGVFYMMRDGKTWTNNRLNAGKFTQETAHLKMSALNETVPVRIALW